MRRRDATRSTGGPRYPRSCVAPGTAAKGPGSGAASPGKLRSPTSASGPARSWYTAPFSTARRRGTARATNDPLHQEPCGITWASPASMTPCSQSAPIAMTEAWLSKNSSRAVGSPSGFRTDLALACACICRGERSRRRAFRLTASSPILLSFFAAVPDGPGSGRTSGCASRREGEWFKLLGQHLVEVLGVRRHRY